jgi:predicted RNase H-like HicB family nuclease
MRKLEYTFWRDEDFFLGYLNKYPDYQTQAYSREELVENLKDLLVDLESEDVPFIKQVEELTVA